MRFRCLEQDEDDLICRDLYFSGFHCSCQYVRPYGRNFTRDDLRITKD